MSNGNMFHKADILEACGGIAWRDPLKNLSNYNDRMTISQVVRFFDRQGILFTKTMIQNYVRIGVMPPPEEKRYYTKAHLILLTLINDLKNIYSLDDIRMLIRPVFNDPTTFEDDSMDISAIYSLYAAIYENALAEQTKGLPALMDGVAGMVDRQEGVKPEDQAKVIRFVATLELMIKSLVAKRLAMAFVSSPNSEETRESEE